MKGTPSISTVFATKPSPTLLLFLKERRPPRKRKNASHHALVAHERERRGLEPSPAWALAIHG